MNNQQLAHVWAQQQKTSGKGSSFYFEGATIYSYGGHFPIARFYTHKEKDCILFTTRSYSHTTSKHINYTRQAIYNTPKPVFYVYDPSRAPSADDLAAYVKRAEEYLSQAARAKSRKGVFTANAESEIARYHAFGKFFGIRTKKNPIDPKRVEALQAAALASAKADRERRKEREAIEKAERELAAIQWRKGEIDATYKLRELPVMLRINGDELQTSQGARVPVDAARVIFSRFKDNPEKINGHAPIDIGEFKIQCYSNGLITAGCHVIPWIEVERVFNT